MSLCPICGKALCDHTAAERGQTEEETHRPLTAEEERRVSEDNLFLYTMIQESFRLRGKV